MIEDFSIIFFSLSESSKARNSSISISLVAVGGISASLEKREEKELMEQQELAIGAAKMYFSLNNTDCVKIQTLKDNNFFSSEKKIIRLNLDYAIKLFDDKYVYGEFNCD